MPVTQRDLDWMAVRLLPAIYDENRPQTRIKHRLTSLLRELEPMKIQIVEPVFFFGKDRKVGEVMEAPVGPYRIDVQGHRIPQFVELPSEIHVTDNAASSNLAQQVASANATASTPIPPTPSPVTGSFAEATASVLKPTTAPASKPIASAASKIAALTKQRLAFNQDLEASIAGYAQKMTDATTKKSAVFTKAHKAIDDEVAGFDSLDSALTDFEGANGGPLQG